MDNRIIPTPDELARMSWYARKQLERRLAGRPRPSDMPLEDAQAVVVLEDRRRSRKAVTTNSAQEQPVAGPAKRTRIHRIEPGLWEVSNGVSTAWTFSAEAAWNLVALASRRTA